MYFTGGGPSCMLLDINRTSEQASLVSPLTHHRRTGSTASAPGACSWRAGSASSRSGRSRRGTRRWSRGRRGRPRSPRWLALGLRAGSLQGATRHRSATETGVCSGFCADGADIPSQVWQHACVMGCEHAAKGHGLRWQCTAPSVQTHERQPLAGWWKRSACL